MSEEEYVDDPLQVYLRECCTAPPLSREEEIECEQRLRAGDHQAELRLIETNLAMVVEVAQRHPSERVHVLDLIIAGNEELLRAAKAFKGSSDVTFSAHAAACVEAAIAEASRAIEPD
jgi:RNA polymerase primary sigma factor